jgi:hypothetical protein
VYGLDSSGSGYGPVAGSCVYGNETSGSIKAGNLFKSYLTISFSRRTLLSELNYKKAITDKQWKLRSIE